MTVKHERTRFFESHLADLRSVCTEAADVFVCPICLRPFSVDDVDGLLTIGHVWPKCIRERTQRTDQKVLLCKNCNDKIGTYCEAALQRFEELKQSHQANQLYRPRIQVLPTPGLGPRAELRVPIEIDVEQARAKLTFPLNRKTGHPAYNPNELEKFVEYLNLQTDAQGKAVVIAKEHYPVQEEWPRAQAALLGSSYLFAFYFLGYRYIFQICLDPVRNHMLSIISCGQTDEELEFQESKDMLVWCCTECNRTSPEALVVSVPDSETKPRHLRVSVLDYHVRMPIPEDFCALHMPSEIRAVLRHEGAEIVVDITADEVGELLPQPDYCVEGDAVIAHSEGEN